MMQQANASEPQINRRESNGGPQIRLSVWCLLDSRPGHCNQVLGLADALQRATPANVSEISIHGVTHGLVAGFAPRRTLPPDAPDLVIGAGHRTHVPLLQFGRRFGAATVVLMKPTFPLRLFDFCLVPDVYSFAAPPDSLIPTTGVLNRVQHSDRHDSKRGLFLIGGPCDHHRWDENRVLRQMMAVTERTPQTSWTLAASRRTPDSFIDRVRQQLPQCRIQMPDDAGPEWLPGELSCSGTVWVTQDSVSMMYEAVSSGAATGVLQLDSTRRNRAVQCVDLLLEAGDVTSWQQWVDSGSMQCSGRTLAEADRCAAEILRRIEWSSRTSDTARNAA